MLVNRNTYGFSSNKKYVEGQGFADVLSSAYRSIVPALKSVGTYVTENKDLIAKPVLGAIGALAATGLTAGVPAIISHIVNRNKGKNRPPSGPLVQPPQHSELFQPLEPSTIPENGKYKEILNNLMQANSRPQVSNIIGSGLKNF